VKTFITILFILSLYSTQSLAGVELMLGVGAGSLDFETSLPSEEKFEFSSFNINFTGTARGNITIGNIQLGMTIARSYNEMNLLRDNSSGTDSSFQHLYYGPHLGLLVSASFRLDFEYYTDSTHEILSAEDKDGNPFSKKDKIFGRGYGVGCSFLKGQFIMQLLFQVFTPEKVELGDSEYQADSKEVGDFEVKNIAFNLGILF
jgi:hypothetical protein